ncbi:hypothetical protein GI582_05410 [Sulfitobacter sp. BDSS02]|nr:hypothetical protein [Sulfitobacter sp. BDSS02]MBR9848479.1 MFS transporter [Paracoccaceae bacterium]
MTGAGLACISGAVLANGIATPVALQTGAPEEVRGRVPALCTMAFRGLPALGAVVFGLLGAFVPLRATFSVLGLVVLTIAVVSLRVLRSRMCLESRSSP